MRLKKALFMSERSDRDYLNHIVEAGRRIDAYTVKMTWEEFVEDVKTAGCGDPKR